MSRFNAEFMTRSDNSKAFQLHIDKMVSLLGVDLMEMVADMSRVAVHEFRKQQDTAREQELARAGID